MFSLLKLSKINPHAENLNGMRRYNIGDGQGKAFKAPDIDPNPLHESTFIVEKATEPPQTDQLISHIIQQVNQQLQIHKITVPTITGFSFLDVDRIIYCEASDNYTVIHLTDQTQLTVSRTLHDYEKKLSVHTFIRIHQKHLVNLKHINEYIKGKNGGYVMMSDGTQLEVSLRKKADLIKAVNLF